MARVITIGREFGSGGREIAKRLSDELEIAYYDNEIIKKITEESGFDADVVQKYTESKIIRQYPLHFARTMTFMPMLNLTDEIYMCQARIIKELAQNDCIIVGRCADAILKKEDIFKIFVYSSSMEKRLERCYEKVPADRKNKSEKMMTQEIKKIDKMRAEYYNYYTGQLWGKIQNYHMGVDTAKFTIKQSTKLILHALECAEDSLM